MMINGIRQTQIGAEGRNDSFNFIVSQVFDFTGKMNST